MPRSLAALMGIPISPREPAITNAPHNWKPIMKTQISLVVPALAAVLALGAAAHAQGQYIFTPQGQYNFTPVDYPGASQTSARAVSGTNLVGFYIDSRGNEYGYIYNGSTWTTLSDPLAGIGPSGGTAAAGISSTNIVGVYWDTSGNQHGFLYDGRNWTKLDDPNAAPGPNAGTAAQGISGTSIVGWYVDAEGVNHGFFYSISSSNWTTLDDPFAGSRSGQGTFANGISGTNIVGQYYDINGAIHGFLYDGVAWATIDDPSGSDGTYASGISGRNIVGSYWDSSDHTHGFLYNGSTWTNKLDDPLAPIGHYPGGGTFLRGIEGTQVVGDYYVDDGNVHGFLVTPMPQLVITQSSGGLAISWPYSPFVTWTVQQCSDLTTTNWTIASGAISNDATNNSLTVTAPADNLFFRLQQQ